MSKRRRVYVDMAASMTVHYPRAADAGKAHCPRTHHALGCTYVPPSGGWRWLTFGAGPVQGEAETEAAALKALRRCWGLY
jgi:hypothetical protein